MKPDTRRPWDRLDPPEPDEEPVDLLALTVFAVAIAGLTLWLGHIVFGR